MTLKFTANLSWLCTEVPLVDRFALAGRLGFKAVECGLPYEISATKFAAAWAESDLPMIMLNAATGDREAGEYGLAALPGRGVDFRDALNRSLDYALPVKSRFVHVLAGMPPGDADPDACFRTYVENLAWACEKCSAHGIGVLIEPINTLERPGYFLTTTKQAARVVDAVGQSDIGIQYDFHNAQLMEGDLTRTVTAYFDIIHHVQIAGLPGRSPPDRGEIACPYVFRLLEGLGYEGWVGCEYRPGPDTAATLDWAKGFGIGA